MDLLLINPSYFAPAEMSNRRVRYDNWIRGGNMYIHPFEPPLGLGSLSAYLREKGFSVELVDMPGLEMTQEQLLGILQGKSPRFVGITAMTPTFGAAQELAHIIKQVLPETKVVLGGVHPTVHPEQVLKNRDIDFVIRGEGEFAMGVLLERAFPCSSEDLPGVCFRRNGSPVISPKAPAFQNLDFLPLPDYGSLPLDRYIQYNEALRGIRGVSMLASRGCPYPCSFCAVQETMGKKWRAKSPKKVVDEMTILRDVWQLDGIWFKDSIFNLNKRWVSAFCSEIKRRGLKILWQYNTRVNLVNEEELIMEKEAGLVQIDLGIESGSPKSLKTLRKGIDIDEIHKAVQIAKKYVKVAGFFMIGIPGETQEDIEMTFELAKKLNLDKCTWSLFSPLPGSALYEYLKSQTEFVKQLEELGKIHFTENPYSFCHVPDDKLRKIYRQINEYFSYAVPTEKFGSKDI